MLANFRSLSLPALCGPALIDGLGLPRYWAAVWASFQPADLAPSTLSKKLSHLESFYQHAEDRWALEGWTTRWLASTWMPSAAHWKDLPRYPQSPADYTCQRGKVAGSASVRYRHTPTPDQKLAASGATGRSERQADAA